jgi:alkylhydroperoxidase family enzyme
VGRKSGLEDRQLAELHDYLTSDAFNTLERLVLQYAEALTERQVNVPDVLFAELRGHFSDQQLVELTSTIAWENYRARFNRGLNIEADGFMEGASCVIPQAVR